MHIIFFSKVEINFHKSRQFKKIMEFELIKRWNNGFLKCWMNASFTSYLLKLKLPFLFSMLDKIKFNCIHNLFFFFFKNLKFGHFSMINVLACYNSFDIHQIILKIIMFKLFSNKIKWYYMRAWFDWHLIVKMNLQFQKVEAFLKHNP